MVGEVERHVMDLVKTLPNGVEEWLCPTCGRCFQLNWPPNYKRVILVKGNENAIHSGGKNGVRMETDEMGVEVNRSGAPDDWPSGIEWPEDWK